MLTSVAEINNMTRQNKPLIVGIGNPLRGDDGLAQEILRRLADGDMRDLFDTLATHQLLPEHAEVLHRYEQVIFVDACVDLPAGDWQITQVEMRAHEGVSAHILAPSVLLTFAQTIYGSIPSAWCLCIGAEQFELGQQLSTKVVLAIEECFPHLVALGRVQGPTAHA